MLSLDITSDIVVKDFDKLTKWIAANISNNRLYLSRQISRNLIIYKNVKSDSVQLTIYNKAKEMALAKNRDFLNTLSVDEARRQVECFTNVARFEMRLTTKKLICRHLNVADTTLSDVLSTNMNPIYELLKDMIEDDLNGIHISRWNDFRNYCVFEYCGCDMQRVEAYARQFCGYNYKSRVDKVREVCAKDKDGYTKADLLDTIQFAANTPQNYDLLEGAAGEGLDNL